MSSDAYINLSFIILFKKKKVTKIILYDCVFYFKSQHLAIIKLLFIIPYNYFIITNANNLIIAILISIRPV